MSREVEVQNIQLTATTPEDIQISLGAIGDSAAGTSLAENTGYLTSGSVSGVTTPATDYDWSNTADISHYYTFGRLIPASSTTGENIFFTPDANGVGKTVKADGKFYQAATKLTATDESDVGNSSSTDDLKTTAHLNVASDTWLTASSGGYTKSVSWNGTNDDGYYVDIPVWLRTSSTEGAEISVQAVVYDVTEDPDFGTDTDATADGKELYKAVRVAVLDSTGAQISYKQSASAATATAIGILPVADGEATPAANKTVYDNASIIDYYQRTTAIANNGGAVNNLGTGATANTPTYATVTPYTVGTKIAKLDAGSGTDYGTASQFIIRVWLEGEDPDCYNETAGQDWAISLRFNNETTNPTT